MAAKATISGLVDMVTGAPPIIGLYRRSGEPPGVVCALASGWRDLRRTILVALRGSWRVSRVHAVRPVLFPRLLSRTCTRRYLLRFPTVRSLVDLLGLRWRRCLSGGDCDADGEVKTQQHGVNL